jgi:hypothetical protein
MAFERFDTTGAKMLDYSDFVKVPEVAGFGMEGDSLTVTVPLGEIRHSADSLSPRDTRDKMAADMVRNGASPEWAQQKASEAARSWDRGVRGGTIKTR